MGDLAAADPQPPVPVLDGFDLLGTLRAENLIHPIPVSHKMTNIGVRHYKNVSFAMVKDRGRIGEGISLQAHGPEMRLEVYLFVAQAELFPDTFPVCIDGAGCNSHDFSNLLCAPAVLDE